MTQSINKIKVVHHISRIEGQLKSVKDELQKESTDCKKASATLLAVSRSIASLRKVFVQCMLEEKYLKKNLDEDEVYQSLIKVING